MRKEIFVFFISLLCSISVYAKVDSASVYINGSVREGTVIDSPVSEEDIIISVGGLNLVARIQTLSSNQFSAGNDSVIEAPDVASSWTSIEEMASLKTPPLETDELGTGYNYAIDLNHTEDDSKIDAITIHYGIFGNVPTAKPASISVKIEGQWEGPTPEKLLLNFDRRFPADDPECESGAEYIGAKGTEDSCELILTGKGVQTSVIVVAAHTIEWGVNIGDLISGGDYTADIKFTFAAT